MSTGPAPGPVTAVDVSAGRLGVRVGPRMSTTWLAAARSRSAGAAAAGPGRARPASDPCPTAVKRLPGYNILTTFNIGVGDDPR